MTPKQLEAKAANYQFACPECGDTDNLSLNFPSPPEVKIRGRWHKIRSAIWDNQGRLARLYTIPLDQSGPFGPFYDLEGDDLRGLVFRQPKER